MLDDISATGWLVILCCLALGFGGVRFTIAILQEKDDESQPEGGPPKDGSG